MKKIGLIMVVAAGMFASCGRSLPEAELKTSMDTLSYTSGVTRARGFQMAVEQQMGIDSAHLKSFFKGMLDGMKIGDNKNKSAYYLGIKVGEQVVDMGRSLNNYLTGSDSIMLLNQNDFLAGFMREALNQNTAIPMDSAAKYVDNNMERVKEEFLRQQYAEHVAENEQFLEENKTKDSVQVTESGLQYKILVQGKGPIAEEKDRVKVKYVGRTIDGEVFDRSRREPTTFRLNQVIEGWSEALKMMPAGSRWIIYIPSELAYGSRVTKNLKPFSTLIFDVELVEVVKNTDKK